jgi:DNA repair exonuclease SbcCD ATPase subunit
MDPLSITASAIAIIQISGAIINTCYTYRSRLKSASKDASRIINELNALRTIIEDLYQLLYDENKTKAIYESTLSKLSQPDGILATCLASLEELSKKLEPKEGWKATKAAILWPLKESDMKRALQDIDITKDTVQLALAADQRFAACVFLKSLMLIVQIERPQLSYKITS